MKTHCIEKSLEVPFTVDFEKIEKEVKQHFVDKKILRFVSTKFDKKSFSARLLFIEEHPQYNHFSIFSFQKRDFSVQKDFNICFIIPTGIVCEIGGHAGDGTAALRAISASCNKVITHPNVVNASDINEMPKNALYVEGSHLTNLLMGTIGLNEVRQNKVLVIIDNDQKNNRKFKNLAINSVNGARAILGLNADISILEPSILMKGALLNNTAIGRIDYLENLYQILKEKEGSFDAIAITSQIDVEESLHTEYSTSNGDMANPWGAVESMLTHFISSEFVCPSAHAPMFENNKVASLDMGVVDARIAPEVVSNTFFHCVLKGLHQAPRIIRDKNLLNHPNIFSVKDISAVVIPDGILGLPVLAALRQGIKVVAVKNKNQMKNDLSQLPWGKDQFYQCDNYLEASGILNCLKEGISVEAIKRPFKTLMREERTRTEADLSNTKKPFQEKTTNINLST